MGEPIRLVISVDAETQRILNRWQEQFSPLVGTNRSRLVRLAVQTLDRLGFTAQTVMEALNAPQRIITANVEQPVTTLNNSSQLAFPSAVESPETLLGPKPPMRASPPCGARRRNISHVSRMDDVEVVEAWVPHFPGKVSPINSTPYERVA